MKKTKPRVASTEKRARRSAADKKSAGRSARNRSSLQHRVAGRNTVDEDGRIASALSALVEISVEMRDLLVQIRDALAEGGETEPEAVDTLVISEAEPRRPPEDEF